MRRHDFRDSADRVWTVGERVIPEAEWTSADEQSDLAGYGVGWLYFESDGEVRRLRLYPKDWRRASDAELDRLCSRAPREPDLARRTD